MFGPQHAGNKIITNKTHNIFIVRPRKRKTDRESDYGTILRVVNFVGTSQPVV